MNTILMNEAGEGGGGGAPPATPPTPPADKTFTQAELDRIVQKRVADAEKKYADHSTLKERAAKAEELQAKLEEFESKGKPAGDVAVSRLEKQIAKLQSDLETSTKKLTESDAKAGAAEKARRDSHIGTVARDALAKAKAVPGAMKHAAALFAQEAKSELDIDDATGEIRGVQFTVGTTVYDDAAKAAEAWLLLNPHFASAPAGGAGTRHPNGGAPLPRDLSSLPTDELARLAQSDLAALSTG